MKENTKNSSILSMILFITIVTLVNATQQIIPPNLNAISIYFGFGGEISQLGILTSAFTILSGIAMVIFGYLSDKIVRKWIVFIGTIIYSIFSIAIMVIPAGINGYILFFFLTCMTGIGYGAIIPSIFSLIGDLIKKDDRSKGFSFFSIASLLGMGIGVVLATAFGENGWKTPYFVIGIAGLINTLIILFFKEPSRLGKDTSLSADKDAVEYSYRIKKDDLKVIFKKKSNIWLIINFCDTVPTGIILFLLYSYMEEVHNISEEVTLIILVLILLSTLFGTVIFGSIGDKRFKNGNKKARVNLALMANVVPIPFVFIALIIPFELSDGAGIGDLFSNPGSIIMILLMVIGLFINGAVNGSWYATIVDLNLPEHRGTILATANFFDILGKSIGPLIGAIIADNINIMAGMISSIFFWIVLPFFWIAVVKNFLPEYEETEKIFAERISELERN